MKTTVPPPNVQHPRPRLDSHHAALLAHRADALGVTQENYLRSLIVADADRVATAPPHTWADVTRQLDRLSAAVVLLATVQAELTLDLQTIEAKHLQSLGNVVAEVEKLLVEATRSEARS